MGTASYKRSHPWICFEVSDLGWLQPPTWMLFGEARSKCQRLTNAALDPNLADALNRQAKIEGIYASSAIDGSTLSVAEISGLLDGTFKVPKSRQYQGREIENLLAAIEDIERHLPKRNDALAITSDLILNIHKRLTDGAVYEDHLTPGEYRSGPASLQRYIGPAAHEVPELIEELVEWLEGSTFKSDDPEIQFTLTFAQAVYAHLYIAWIQPFGDGNGRVGRLVEFFILARGGQVPLAASYLLTQHYNLTRDRYYRELSKASTNKDTVGFVSYALQGFVDGLRTQLETVCQQQLDAAWTCYVHEIFSQYNDGPSKERQLALLLAMPAEQFLTKKELLGLSAPISAAYALISERTLSRDLDRLSDTGLIIKQGRTWAINRDVVKGLN